MNIPEGWAIWIIVNALGLAGLTYKIGLIRGNLENRISNNQKDIDGLGQAFRKQTERLEKRVDNFTISTQERISNIESALMERGPFFPPSIKHFRDDNND